MAQGCEFHAVVALVRRRWSSISAPT